MDEKEVALSIAELKLQVSSIDSRMEKIEDKLDQLVALDRTIAELNIHHENDTVEKQSMWNRLDSISIWKESHERDEADQRAKIIAALEANNKAFSTTCSTIENKVDSWVNRGRGAMWTASLFLGLIQVIAFASIAWTFNHISSLEEHVLKIEARNEQHDKDHARLELKITSLSEHK